MEDVRPLRPRKGSSGTKRTRNWRTWILFGIVPVIVVLLSAIGLWVDLMWFAELGQRSVKLKRIQWSLAMGIGSGLLTFAIVYVNLRIAGVVAKNDMYVPFLATPVGREDAPQQPTLPHFVMRPLMLGASVVIALLAGLTMAGRWETVLRFLGRSDFGVTDPLFGRDASFYVFTVPMLRLVVGYLQTMVVVTALAVAAAYVAMGVIRYLPAPRIAHTGVLHLVGLGAAFFALQAASFRIDAFDIVLSRRGVATGAGYADVHARLPGAWVMVVASLVVAVAFVVLGRRGRWRRVGQVGLAWLVLAALAGGIVPAIVQKVVVEPNEVVREAKILRNNIRMTRIGFDLGKVEPQDFADESTLTPKQLAANSGTTSNIRIWSPDILLNALVQLQEFRTYYEFSDVDVDRYRFGGELRQVMVAAREINPDRASSRSWVTQRLQYTHGYGVVGVWPNRSTRSGRPDMFLRDLPPAPAGQDEITLDRPEIYFGEQADHYVVVNTSQKEFDYPRGESNQLTRYAGSGGIRIRSLAHRIALAAHFGDPRIVLTSSITDRSRLMFRRNIAGRVHELAPFLSLDGDPYLVVNDGRITWVVDCYTTSDRFPYSQHHLLTADGREVNYVRNSVKATVDAYDGSVTLYAVDDADPILKAWRRIFPSLFTDADEMPDWLREHMRYPQDLFNTQTDMWRIYHMSDPQTFYNKEDMWDVPVVGGQTLSGFYVMARLPGEKQEETLLVRPMAPHTKKNMIAYMAARMDPPHYGEVVTLELSKQKLTQGPQQVQARIKQDPQIAEQLKLWRQGDTSVIFGNMLVLPVENSLLYAQPVYLQSSEAQLPEFERIVLVLGETVVWGATFAEASSALFAEQGIGGDGTTEGVDADGTSGDGASDKGADQGSDRSGTGLSRAELQELVGDVATHYDKALACQRSGDWACYGRETDEVEQLLGRASQGDGTRD